MENHLHIICLNIPYPVDYGGVFDLFYKLPALQKQGIKIHLHCFDYGRGPQPELNHFCESVNYYKRATNLNGFSFEIPYIVSSRKNQDLFNNLLQDDHPILMEGIHCTYLLTDNRFANRRCVVRLHNVEHIYYNYLSLSANIGFKKLYYWWESILLKKFEKRICNNAHFVSVSEKDAVIYRNLGCKKIEFLPLFLPPWQISALKGEGTFCLYQGDLSVFENQKAAKWLLEEVFSSLEIPLVIAGKNPPEWLVTDVYKNNNVCLVANPKEEEMQDMIAKSQINVIPSFNATGIKLKLINALYNGRHCLVNTSTVEATGLEPVCCIADTAGEFKEAIQQLFVQPYTLENKTAREELLANLFNNKNNSAQLKTLLFSKEGKLNETLTEETAHAKSSA